MIDRLLLWGMGAAQRLRNWLIRVHNRRQVGAQREHIVRLVNQGRLCSQETPGLWCGPVSHDVRCYYSRFPKGMLPPRREADGTP